MATLQILLKRRDNLVQRERSLEEIDSDLMRVEAHIDLALDHATLQKRPQAISTNIELASQLLDGGLYGTSESAAGDVTEIPVESTTTEQDTDSTTISTPRQRIQQ